MMETLIPHQAHAMLVGVLSLDTDILRVTEKACEPLGAKVRHFPSLDSTRRYLAHHALALGVIDDALTTAQPLNWAQTLSAGMTRWVVVNALTDARCAVLLNAGVEDAVTSCSAALSARVALAARRSLLATCAPTLTIGDLVINRSLRRIYRNDVEIALTSREWEILVWLLDSYPAVARIVDLRSYSCRFATSDELSARLHVCICHLRRKLEADSGIRLLNARGLGYQLTCAAG